MGVLDYDTVAGDNIAIGGISILGTAAVANFDNAFRQMMADIANGIPTGDFLAVGYTTKAVNYAVVVGDKAKLVDCTAALELDLPAVATAGAGFFIWVKANGGAVTVDPSGTENINGASTSLVVSDGSSALVVCTGAAWHSVTVGSVTTTGTQTLTNKDISATTNTYRAASETVTGAVELATDAEAQTGTDTARALTPANLQAVTATTARKGVAELATAAEVVTGTDADRVPSVSVLTNHKGVAKAWAAIAGASGTPSVTAGYNVTSIADNGVGLYTVTLAVTMADANYSVVATATNAFGRDVTIQSKTTTTFQLRVFNGGSAADSDLMFSVYGDLA